MTPLTGELISIPGKTLGGMTYGSVCSGIEAASVAWHSLGWQPLWFAEIEKFPAAVLAHHFPDVANLGDMTRIADAVRRNIAPAPDVLVGGTPCQAFSIAGLRNSLDDERGQLTLAYVDLANAIDEKRAEEGKAPAFHVWENVPGSLSTKDNAFGFFLAGLVGESEPLTPGKRPEPGKSTKFWRWNKNTNSHVVKWPKSGCAYGRQRRLAWRVIDAQYCAVAQRRSRVFVVASARDDIDPAEILLEFDGVRRDSPPRRKSGETVTGTLTSRAGAGGGLGTDFECDGGLIADHNDVVSAQTGHLVGAFGGGNCSGALDVAACLTAKGQRNDFDVETFAVQSANVAAQPIGCDGTIDGPVPPLMARSSRGGSQTLSPGYQTDGHMIAVHPIPVTQEPDTDTELSHSIGRNQLQAAYGHAAAHVAFAENNRGEVRLQNGDGQIIGPLTTGGGKPGQSYPAICSRFDVRRLTPKECERLQGFPDGWTLIPEKKRKQITEDDLAYLRLTMPELTEDEARHLAADGPRYKAIGNAMAVPVMRWIGMRIASAVTPAEIAPATVNDPAPTMFSRQKPFLKWAGGKFKVLDVIASFMPEGKRLIEPFVGAGSVFMNLSFSENLLADVNPDLINLYQQLEENSSRTIMAARELVEGCTDKDDYEKIRDEFNQRKADSARHAALFLALLRTCFNGLCRYNLKDKFNVGWCKKERPYFPEKELIDFIAQKQKREFICGSFKETILRAGAGDVVFCDPPYERMPGQTGFTAYAKGSFTFAHQVELVEACVAAYERGARIVITNSGAPIIQALYIKHGFKIHRFTARRAISRNADSRGDVVDIIAVL